MEDGPYLTYNSSVGFIISRIRRIGKSKTGVVVMRKGAAGTKCFQEGYVAIPERQNRGLQR